MNTLRELLADAEAALRAGPHPDKARLNAETLLLHLLNRNRAWLLAHSDDHADATTQTELADLIARRRAGEPIQYITGKVEFFGLPFAVTPDVLIPRPETEHLVEEVLRLSAQSHQQPLRIADIGTGSGAIAVALAHKLPQAQITATDISFQGLAIARNNAVRNHVADRIQLLAGDLLTPLNSLRFEIIASNPPYVPLRDRESLSVEVRDYEPDTALFAGDDGVAIYRRLIPEAQNFLVPGGWLVLEIGHGQQAQIEELLRDSSYCEIHFVPDYQGIPRVAVARRD